jgi:hypothetical protein
MAKPLIIDVEASGFGRGSYPIEVGVALGDGETRCLIIRREPEWVHWDVEAEALHGISREVLDHYGNSPLEVASKLNEWLYGEVVYSDAWGNDSSWLALLFDVAGLPQYFKVESLRVLLADEQLPLWHQTKNSIESKVDGRRHRASHDALVLQQTFDLTANNLS